MSPRTGSFFGGAAKAPLAVLTDFDFTISQVDVGDLVVESLCPPAPGTRAAVQAGQAGSRAWWLDSMARVDLAAAEALADTVAIDPHFPAFVSWCESESIPLAVVSDGFGFYIHRILTRNGLGHLPVFCNEMAAPGSLHFPHGNSACDRCGCCKAGVVRRVRSASEHVVYVGDGTSDVYASAYADWVFAKSFLARYLLQHQAPFFPFDTFRDVQTRLQGALGAFRSGEAPGRVSLTPHAHCRF